MAKHQIQIRYDEMKALFGNSPINPEITAIFKDINDLCQYEINNMEQVPLISNTTARGKNYIVFKNTDSNTISRPVNIDLYNEGLESYAPGVTKIDVFWDNVLNQSIAEQPARDITTALYAIAMNYCCCADLIDGVKKNAGDYYEKLIGHLYSRHLNVCPSTQMDAVELDDATISIPTDFIFNLGPNRPKLHVPVKTSTRERVVEVWAQQRILDGAFGVGRFICLLTCIGETNYVRPTKNKGMSVDIVCVPNQWINYQLFISQIKRAYYLDVPDRYDFLNHRFPRIHVKEFGEFFHESDSLCD